MAIIAIVAFIITFLSTYILTNIFISYLKRKDLTVKDYHKPGEVRIPMPGGPALVIPILVVEIMIYILTQDIRVISLILTVLIVFIIGIVDDFYKLSGVVKPTLLILGSLPIIILKTYNPYVTFPLFGTVRLTILYPILVLIAITITSNTINTIDVLNGVVSGFSMIATIPIIFALILKADYTAFIFTLPLLASLLAFYIYHRYPSKIFPGDSGSLSIGAMYGAITILGGVEIVGVVALLPAILNSFLFLSSVKRLIEHREIKERPVIILEDYRLAASVNPSAPITLVRLILADGPLNESEIVREIFKLAIFTMVLALITAYITWGL
ncbi:MAG: UDP-N-acetylglucosamine-1-phosphate transferase [Nitrososphaerota archaeon]|nr:UDP-N-acetylglucosamine-1-phosphate transferase [Nitrososphaerota archaeon]